MSKQRFKDITDLTDEQIDAVDQMLIGGFGPKRVRTVIKSEWGLWPDKSDAAAEKLLTRYKKQVIEARLIRELDAVGFADARRFASVFNPLNVAHEMAMALAETGYHAKQEIDRMRELNSPITPAQHINAIEKAFSANKDYTLLLDKIGLRPKMQLGYREAVAPSDDPKVVKLVLTSQVMDAAQRIRDTLGDRPNGARAKTEAA